MFPLEEVEEIRAFPQPIRNTRWILRVVILFTAGLSLAACMASPSRVGESSPTVTYKYYGDTYGSQYDEVAERARDYCDAEFDKSARFRNVDEGGEERYATFECI